MSNLSWKIDYCGWHTETFIFRPQVFESFEKIFHVKNREIIHISSNSAVITFNKLLTSLYWNWLIIAWSQKIKFHLEHPYQSFVWFVFISCIFHFLTLFVNVSSVVLLKFTWREKKLENFAANEVKISGIASPRPKTNDELVSSVVGVLFCWRETECFFSSCCSFIPNDQIKRDGVYLQQHLPPQLLPQVLQQVHPQLHPSQQHHQMLHHHLQQQQQHSGSTHISRENDQPLNVEVIPIANLKQEFDPYEQVTPPVSQNVVVQTIPHQVNIPQLLAQVSASSLL